MEKLANNVSLLRQFAYIYKKLIFKSRSEYILSRTACLGTDILQILKPNYSIYNMQKNRIDLLNSQLTLKQPSKLKLNFKYLHPIKEFSIKSMVLQQSNNRWMLGKKPRFIIMDTFSELTDQKFIYKNKNEFFCNYNDVSRELLNIGVIKSEGLLDKESIPSEYFSFFKNINLIFPNIPIFVIIFPSKFETRPELLERAGKISEAIEVCATKFLNLHVISIPDGEIEDKPVDSKYIYHYSEKVKRNLANKILTNPLYEARGKTFSNS
jgi:hypothetical protein